MRIPRSWMLSSLVLYWVGIFAATHLPAARLPDVHLNDKTEHFVAYFLLCLLLSNEISFRSRITRGDWAVLCIIALYGAGDEWTQQFVGRGTELFDWFADMAGASSAIIVWGSLRWLVYALRGRRRLSSMNEIAISGCNVDQKADAPVR